ncbi:Nem1-Spo7 phosphatase catalytic subunit NEM1 [Sporobolomyces salmoneus]|uniref:Nem1-Spo7 phosphatase catalytic subunit NEM1 n=1 Tax=Sporobolomyces salmoneus TaxID=183962 RepID=UPI00317C2572
MNTLSYFLSTLRPTPPPSAQASTSELPLELVTGADSTRLGLNRLRDQKQALSEDVLDTGTDREGTQKACRDETSGERTERVGAGTSPSRKGSRKGKSRASTLDPMNGTLEPLDSDDKIRELSESEETLPFHDKQPTPSTPTTTTVTLLPPVSTPSRTWPFVSRLAQTWPFRLTTSLYLLIRRFLSLFGLSYPPRPLYNSLLAPLSTELDPEKSVVSVRSTIVSLSLQTPPPSVPPSPGTSSFSQQPIPRPIRAPPRLTPKTLVLDLDETLIHSTSRPVSGRARGRSVPKGLKTTMVEVVLDGRSTMYTVYKRPWVDFFLRKVSSWYTVIIFTASLPEYADPVIDWLDGGDGRGGLIGGRLFRSHCLAKNGTYMKDLTVVERDLARVCLVDNSPVSYAINQANGIPIEGWINDPNDECLLDLLPMLDSLRFTNDVRRVLGLRGFGKSSTSTSQTPSSVKRNSTNLAMTSNNAGSIVVTAGGTGDGRRKS